MFAKIGAGDTQAAMKTLLECCHQNGIAVPLHTCMSLRDWLDGYVGTEVETALRPHVDTLYSRLGGLSVDPSSGSGEARRGPNE